MKKKSGWIAFYIGIEGEICLHGEGRYPIIYRTKREALKVTWSTPKMQSPAPVKIEWMVEE